MAAYGIPGGPEWLVILLVLVLLFLPAVAVFLGGFVTGKAHARYEAMKGMRAEPSEPEGPAEAKEADDE